MMLRRHISLPNLYLNVKKNSQFELVVSVKYTLLIVKNLNRIYDDVALN